MDPTNEPNAAGEQQEPSATSGAADEWNTAPTERHLDQRQEPPASPTSAEYSSAQPYPPQQPTPPRQPYPEQPYAQSYPPSSYGRVVDPSLPLGREQHGPREAWQGGREGERERRRTSPWVPIVGGCLVVVAAAMVLCAVAAGILFNLNRNSATVSATQSRTFSTDGTATITLQAGAGNVRVVPGDTNQVKVVLDKEVSAISRDRAQNALDQIALDVTQTGNNLTININEPSFSGLDFFSRRLDLTVTTPATTNLDATLSAGNLTIRGLAGTLKTNMSAGNLTIDNVTIKDQATLRMDAGNLDLTHVTGGVTVTSSFGNVSLSDTTLTQNSSIRSSAGNVTVEGSLQSGASLDVTDSAGNVSVTLPKQTSAHLNATADAGKITVEGWPGLNQNTSGANSSVTGDLGTNPTSTVTLRVDAGNITITAE